MTGRPGGGGQPDRPVVVGLMGAGKTTVARALARALHRPLRDSDPELTARYGGTAADQAARDGVEVLHAREARHLREALGQRPAPVIAAAASVVDDPGCREALRSAYVVWLDAPAAVLARRIHPGDHRPRPGQDLEAMLAADRRRRAVRYAQLADLVVDVTRTGPAGTVSAVLAALRDS